MYNRELPISVEEFAAYLDNNLNNQEMSRISETISENAILSEFVKANDVIEKSWDSNSINSFDEIDFEEIVIPSLETLDSDLLEPDLSELKKSVEATDILTLKMIDEESNETLYYKESISNSSIHNNITNMGNYFGNQSVLSEAELAARKVFGENGFGPDGGFDPVIYQGREGVCAIRSQQIILRDYGIDISLEELKQYAIQNNWYAPGEEGGTPLWAIGNLLLSCNVPCQQSSDNTVYDLINELAQGHRVIVGVDANELWASREHDIIGETKEWFKDFFSGETPNHALVVAGVEVNPNNPDDVKVVLTDPGTGDLRITYDLNDFMDAWKDSSCFMVSTTVPAPLQYDPIAGCEVPSNFAISEYIDANSMPLSPNNIILPGQMAAMCAGAHYSDGHLDTIPVEDKEVNYEDFKEAVEKNQQYRAAIGGGAHLPGQDHFDKDAFVSSLMQMFHLNHEERQSAEVPMFGGANQSDIDDSGHTDDKKDSPLSHIIGGDDGTDGSEDYPEDND